MKRLACYCLIGVKIKAFYFDEFFEKKTLNSNFLLLLATLLSRIEIDLRKIDKFFDEIFRK